MGLLIQNQRTPESTPLRSETLTLVEYRIDLLDFALGNLERAYENRVSDSSATNSRDMSQYFRNRVEDMVTLGNGVGRTVGIESTHTHTATEQVKDLTDINGSLNLEKVVGVPADSSVEAARKLLASVHRAADHSVAEDLHARMAEIESSRQAA